MRSVLLAMYGREPGDAGLAAALQIGRTFNSHIVGLYAQPPIQVFVGDSMGLAASYVSDAADAWSDGEAQARDAFRSFMKKNKVRMGKPGKTATKPSAGWQASAGGRPHPLGELGRVFDLTVVARDGGVSGDFRNVMEEALFESGKPVLVVPEEAREKFGRTVVVAWNGSSETARLLTFALPFLRKAGNVTVLTIEGGTVNGPDGSAVANHLGLRGVKATARTRPAGKQSIGEAILQEAAALGADLLIKGAYTQSRLRQMIFGGATKHILSEAKMPVLMAH